MFYENSQDSGSYDKNQTFKKRKMFNPALRQNFNLTSVAEITHVTSLYYHARSVLYWKYRFFKSFLFESIIWNQSRMCVCLAYSIVYKQLSCLHADI